MKDLKKEESTSHKELWIPSFHIEYKDTGISNNLIGSTINKKYLANVTT